jgi:serine/threonine protein kinase
MIGGRIRGQGTYGCVFQPALLCRGITQPSSNLGRVGKITSVEDAQNELSIGHYLHGIPDSSRYTIFAEPDSCTPRPLDKQIDTDIKACEFTRSMPLEKTQQIIMPWGGLPLNRINLSPSTFDFFRFMEELLAAGAFLTLHDVCHMDIWGQNLLFDKDTRPKLIDFGFAFRPSKLTISDLKSRWRVIAVDHDTETPEVTLMLGAFKHISPSIIIKKLEESKPAVQRLAALCDMLPGEWAAQLAQWSNESQSFQQGDWVSCWKLYWPGFDAWALGAVLLQILEIQLAIPEFNSSTQWNERGETVKSVLRGLCCGHPAFRLDAAEALSLFTQTSHPLISAGSVGNAWVSEKSAKRPLA